MPEPAALDAGRQTPVRAPAERSPETSPSEGEGPDATLVTAARRFAERHPDATGRDRAGAIPGEVLDEARALGLFGLAIPERHGGLGLDVTSVAAVVAELARGDRAIATTIGLHNGLGTRALLEAGSDEQKARFLPAMAAGERIGAFAATEPGAGSDLSAVRTALRRDGDTLRLSGEKAYVTNAGFAGMFTVLTRAPADEGTHATALVLVPRESVGVSLGEEERKMGLRASSTRSLFLDDVVVPAGHRLGDGARGMSDAYRSLEWGRTLMAAGCLGTARAALERSLAHAAERRQFRRALRTFSAVRAHLAQMAVSVAAIEATLRRVTGDEVHGLSIERTSAALKVLASEHSCDACDRAVQLHGALGFVEDPGVAILSRDARVTRIFEGANDVLLVRLGSALLAGQGLPRSTDFDVEPALWSARARLAAAVEATRGSLGVTAIAHQRLVVALARADVGLYAAEACALRARRMPRLAALLVEACRRLTHDAVVALDGAGSALEGERIDASVLDSIDPLGGDLVRPS